MPGRSRVAGAGAAGGGAAPVAPPAAHPRARGGDLRGLGPRRDRRAPLALRPGADHRRTAARRAAAGGVAVLHRGTGLRDPRVRGGPATTEAMTYTVAVVVGVLGALLLDLVLLGTRLVL